MISGQESQERSAGDVDLDGVVEPHIGEGGTEEEDEAEKTAADNGHVNNGDDLPHNVRDGEAPIQGDDSMAPGDENRSEVLMLIAK